MNFIESFVLSRFRKDRKISSFFKYSERQEATFKNTIILFVCLPEFCISVISIFSWDHRKSQEKIATMFMQNFGGQTKSIIVSLKVAYGMCNYNERLREKR